LNSWAIKNNYPLLLISDLIDSIETKVFTMDLKWEYNNVRIKKSDEWKIMFLILENVWANSIFKLINSLVTFQTIINDLLRDLINTGDVVAFINNIMVETKKKEVL